METAQSVSVLTKISVDLHERIRRRAEEIYVQGGRIPGRDTENWSQAEREILAESETGKRRMAVVIKINGVKYVGEYQCDACDGYEPGEFAAGSSITVRMEQGKMFIRRPNGKELETRIVRRID